MIAFSFLFLPVRFWTRWKTFRKFFADDAFALLAWLSAVGMGVMASHAKDAMCKSRASTNATYLARLILTSRKIISCV